MALLTQSQINDVTKLAVTMFGAAPGAYKEYFENVYADVGGDMQKAANAYANEAVYSAMFSGTNEQQADQLMARFGINQSDMVGDVPVGQAAYDFFLGSLNNGESTQDIIAVTIPYIAEDPNFAQYNALLNTKVAVANNFSNNDGVNETSLGALQYVINQVTGDETVAEYYDLKLGQDIFNPDGSSTQKIFEADIVNGQGELESGDQINGGTANNDTLIAKMLAEASEAGVTAVRPETNSVENIIINAVSEDANTANNDFGQVDALVRLNADEMSGMKELWSSGSEATLRVENVSNPGDTDKLTIGMESTGNGGASNGVGAGGATGATGADDRAPSNYEVLFEQDELTAGSVSQDGWYYEFLNQASYDVNSAEPVKDFPLDSIRFDISFNGAAAEEFRLTVKDEMAGIDTQAQLRDLLQSKLDDLIATDARLDGLSFFSLGSSFNDGDGRISQRIDLIDDDAADRVITYGSTRLDDDKPAGNIYWDNGDIQRQESDEPVTGTVILDDVGRGSDGGYLKVGSMSEGPAHLGSTGIEVYKLEVREDSNLSGIYTTNHNQLAGAADRTVLDQILITSGAGYEGDLTIGNVWTATNGLNAVGTNTVTHDGIELIQATDFNGDLSLGLGTARVDDLETLDANIAGDVTFWGNVDSNVAGGGDTFNYTTGSGEDTMNVVYDLTAAASDNFSMAINTASGDDSVTLTTVAGTASEFLNHAQQQNVAVNTGSDDDMVALNGNQIAAQVDLGSGADTIYVADNGQDTAAKAQWFVNATNPAAGALGNGNQTYNVFKTQVQIDFQDITSALVAVEYSGDYTTDSKAINEAIKKAIADDPQLSKLLTTTDLMNDGLQIDSLVERNLAAGDLQINFIAPKYATEVGTAGFNQSTSARYGNDTADLFGDRLTVNDTELSNAWNAYYATSQGLGNSLASGTGIYAGLATTGTAAGDAALMFNNMFEFVDSSDATAGNMQTVGAGTGTLAGTTIYNTLQTNAGANSTFNTINDITGGSGDDVLVLSTREAGGWDTVVLTDNFGHDTIMNFNTGTSATPGTVADQIDFTAFLDAAAAARGASNNATDRVDQDVPFTYVNMATVPGGGLPAAAAQFDHNAVVSVNLSGLFASLSATASALPKSFDNITNAQMQTAMNALLTGYINTAGVATAADMDGSKFVIRLVEDAQIELNGTGDATLGNTIATPLVEQIYSGTIVWNSTAGALEFSTVNREGTLEYGDMFSDLSNVAAESVTGTAAAKAEEAAAEAALKNDTDVANPATLVNASQTATSDSNGYPQVVNANGATVSLDNMTVGNGATVTVSYAQIKAWNTTFGDLDINKVTGGTGAVTINGTGDDAATNYAIGGSADYTVTALLADTLDAANVTGNVTVTTADKAATVTTGSGSNTINGNAISDNTNLTVNGAGDATITVVDANVVAGAATGDLSVTGTGTQDKTLTTGTGDDTITGGTGDDTITGGTGTNTLTGGAGADAFTTAATAVDTITDLETGDTIVNNGKVTATNVTSYVTAAAADFDNNGTNEEAIIQAAAAGATIDLSAATSTTAGATIVGGAGVDTLTGSDQDDIIQATTVAAMAADTIDGDAGTGDELQLTSDAQTLVDADLANVSNVEVLRMGDGANSVTFGANATTAGIQVINGGTGVDTIDLSAAGYTLDANTIITNAGADVIRGSAQDDTIVGGAGVDAIDLQDGSTAKDTVVINYSNVGTEADTISGMTVGTDVMAVSLSALEAAGTSGIASTVTDFVDLFDGSSAVIGAAGILNGDATGSIAVGASADVIVLFGATFADTDTLETALEVGGTAAMTGVSAAVNASDAFLLVYSDGVNAYLASAITSNGDNGAGGFASGDLTINNLAQITGDIGIATGDYDGTVAFIA